MRPKAQTHGNDLTGKLLHTPSASRAVLIYEAVHEARVTHPHGHAVEARVGKKIAPILIPATMEVWVAPA